MSRHLDRRPDETRRLLLKGAAAGSLAALGLSVGALPQAHAADAPGWPADAFQQKSEADVIKILHGGKTAEMSDKVKLDAPEIAENGAVVPISVSSTLTGVTAISIVVAENPSVLAASYKFSSDVAPAVANRLKMAKTTNVIALVEADGKLYRAAKEVKVTVGGCGG